MSLVMLDGNIANAVDPVLQRINAGTVGDSHMIGGAMPSTAMAAIVDDSDPRVQYGTFTGTTFTPITTTNYFTANVGQAFAYGGTTTTLNNINDAIQFSWSGTYIAIVSQLVTTGGKFQVYIDGKLTQGRTEVFTPLSLAVGQNDTDIFIGSGSTTFLTASGYVCIDNEIISYASKDSLGIHGCQRGQQGTQATSHLITTACYQWDSISAAGPDSDPEGLTSRRIVWSNHLLSPGNHTIVVQLLDNSGNHQLIFDAFLVKPMLGQSHLHTLHDTVHTSFTTDGNGHYNWGNMYTYNPDLMLMGFLGMNQTTPDTSVSNGNSIIRLGIRGDSNGTPYFYFHNGAANTAYVVNMTFLYLGGTAV